jgi:hypothetical protein
MDFKYLSCEVSYETENDIQQKLGKFSQILGIFNNTFQPNLVQKCSRINVCNALPITIILFGSEMWALKRIKNE